MFRIGQVRVVNLLTVLWPIKLPSISRLACLIVYPQSLFRLSPIFIPQFLFFLAPAMLLVLEDLLPTPVLKINNHATGGWRTKDILGGPKSLETKKLGSSKGWEDQSAEKTNNWKGKKLFNKQMGHRKIKYFIENRDYGWICRNLRAFWEDQTDQNLRWEDQNRF